jgi:hypothetical protein
LLPRLLPSLFSPFVLAPTPQLSLFVSFSSLAFVVPSRRCCASHRMGLASRSMLPNLSPEMSKQAAKEVQQRDLHPALFSGTVLSSSFSHSMPPSSQQSRPKSPSHQHCLLLFLLRGQLNGLCFFHSWHISPPVLVLAAHWMTRRERGRGEEAARGQRAK